MTGMMRSPAMVSPVDLPSWPPGRVKIFTPKRTLRILHGVKRRTASTVSRKRRAEALKAQQSGLF